MLAVGKDNPGPTAQTLYAMHNSWDVRSGRDYTYAVWQDELNDAMASLLRNDVFFALLGKAEQGDYQAMVGGIPCSTFSVARLASRRISCAGGWTLFSRQPRPRTSTSERWCPRRCRA